jgi:hypothetical protein
MLSRAEPSFTIAHSSFTYADAPKDCLYLHGRAPRPFRHVSVILADGDLIGQNG